MHTGLLHTADSLSGS